MFFSLQNYFYLFLMHVQTQVQIFAFDMYNLNLYLSHEREDVCIIYEFGNLSFVYSYHVNFKCVYLSTISNQFDSLKDV